MKVEIKESNQKKEKEFPKLMKSNLGQIIIAHGFNDDGCIMGVLINDNGYPIGDCYSVNWNKNAFTYFEGSITLSND